MKFLQNKTRIYFLGSLLILVICFNSWLLYYNYQQIKVQEMTLQEAGEIAKELDQTLLELVNMETSQRGYLLIKNDNFLRRFHEGSEKLLKNIQRLNALIENSSKQQERLQVIESMIHRREDMLKEVLEDEARQNINLAKRQQLLVSGSLLMKKVRVAMEEMKNFQQSQVEEHKEKTAQREFIFILTLLFSLTFSSIAILMALMLYRKNSELMIREASEKARQSQLRDMVAKGAQAVSGDLSPEEYSKRVKSFLSKHLNVLHMRIFVIRNGRFTRLTCESETVDGDSLIQDGFTRDHLWVVENVPENYWEIKSSLGSAKPNCLLFLPLFFQGERIGLIEMGSFAKIQKDKLEVIKKLANVFAVGLNAVLSRNELQILLEKTQQQAEELETQQEELRANNEELEQQTRALEVQQETLNEKNSQLQDIQVNLEEKAEQLESSSRYKSEFLAKMSHELRTPLNGLLILSSLLRENKERNLNDQQLEFTSSIYKAGEDLLLLINDILDLSKIEARKMEIKPSNFSLGNLVKDMESSFISQADSKNLDLEVKISEDDKKVQIYSDRLRLEQILRNFLSNAIKFTKEGSVTIEAKTISPEEFLISVNDTGIGIAQDKLKLVFEAFEQADSSVDRKFGGTGLGLNIAKELTQLLKGKIEVESEEGSGSRFSVRLPIRLEASSSESDEPTTGDMGFANQPKNSNSAKSPEINTDALAGKVEEVLSKIKPNVRTLMIVEDDQVFLKSVTNLAEDYNFQPIAVENGELAFAILQSHVPDAILLDIKLPGISGMGLLEKIKSSPTLRHIPVHMISALNYQSNALRMGALGYLTKPVTIEKVRSAMDRIESMISDPVRNVLVVEDDKTQAMAISKLVEGRQVETTIVNTGKEALEKVKTQPIDCIVLDLNLPDTDGFRFLDELNSLDISLPPIVIYTGQELTKEQEVHLYKYSESIIIKGARSPERLLDEVNLFLHRVESLLPHEKRQLLSHLRTQEDTFKGKTVLLVDDDLRNVFALTNALESRNLNVIAAKDGQESLEALKNHTEIDLVLMDIMMPVMNGYEAIERIRQSKDFRIKNVPIIALTAKAMREDHEKCIEAGANDYIPKPVNLDHLNTALKVWLPQPGSFQ